MKKKALSLLATGAMLALMGAGCASNSVEPMNNSDTSMESSIDSKMPTDGAIPPADDMNTATTGTPTESQSGTGVGMGVDVDAGASVAAPAVKEFVVTGQNMSFSPASITVKKGDKVRIVFKNVQGFHDWKIDEFNAGTKKMEAGQQETIEFIADKTGSFEYYCSVGSHRAMGMKGTLIVQ